MEADTIQPKAEGETGEEVGWHLVDGKRFYRSESGEVVPGRWMHVVSGRIPVSALDDEELDRGQLKAGTGSFLGGSTNLTRSIRSKIAAEILERQRHRMVTSTREITDGLVDIAINAPDDNVRLRAALAVLDRAGMAPVVKTEAVVEHKYEQTMRKVMVVWDDEDDSEGGTVAG